jgi:hypothetical protein
MVELSIVRLVDIHIDGADHIFLLDANLFLLFEVHPRQDQSVVMDIITGETLLSPVPARCEREDPVDDQTYRDQ